MIELTDLERDVAQEIVSIGLAKAADSMSFFIRDKVMIGEFSLEDQLQAVDDLKEGEYTVLTTELKGELDGVCHLILSKLEKDMLLEASLPESILTDKEKLNVMGEATLLEADNIISASMITQLSNILNVSVYGDVPKIEADLDSKGVQEVLKNSNSPAYCIMRFSAAFGLEGKGFCPLFLWFVNCEIKDRIKEFVKNDENLKKLEELK